MSPEEYANLAEVERRHWYYVGKREIIRHWMDRTCGIHAKSTLLDCGAGSGAFAEEMQAVMDVKAMDDHEESLEILKQRLSQAGVICGSCTEIPLGNATVDIVTALDVLEHIPEDHLAAAEMVRILRPGGWIFITVPALMCLWSDWDVSLHHQRRYDRKALLDVFEPLPLHIEHCAYINVLAMPLVWLARKLRAIGFNMGARAEDCIPPALLNRLLKAAFVKPAVTRWHFPFGVGLLLVARKC